MVYFRVPTFGTNMSLLRILSIAALLCTLPHVSSGQWQPYNANSSGVQAVRSITTQGTAIYLASFPLGVYKSTNDGASWTAVNTGLPNTSGLIFIESVGSNATHVFAGTQSGVYRSSNGGSTWTLANGTLTANANVFANKFFNFGGVTFVVMSGMISNGGGVYSTINNGDTWSVSHAGMGSNMTVYHMASINNVLYAATSAGLVRSTNNGVNWTSVSGSNFAMYSIQGTPTRLVCISDAGYKYSTNGGTTWQNATGGVATPLAKSQLILYDSKYFAITGGSQGVLQSTNQGASWTAFNTGFTPNDAISQEEFHASGTKLYVGALFDIYSINGTTTSVEGEVEREAALPHPYPTVFTDGFQIDLSELGGGNVLLLDASGRVVANHNDLPGQLVRIERNGLAPGNYRVVIDRNGRRSLLGTVIAD
jgi:photosystem II stability/assembly factor-like uncharacterized protein